jgi:hypothetical protein
MATPIRRPQSGGFGTLSMYRFPCGLIFRFMTTRPAPAPAVAVAVAVARCKLGLFGSEPRWRRENVGLGSGS